MKLFKKIVCGVLSACMVLSLSASLTGCGSSNEKTVIIYSNADDEAVESMKKTLDANGYEGKYTFQSFGTSELGASYWLRALTLKRMWSP